MSIYENIKKARKAAGISQKELAERLGVYQKDISRWENGGHAPTLEMFAEICKALQASADEMLELNK
ncbi:MAG: XRE family transcriptional regulator [Clostridia bacterium]|nr:XRE family transcriptional regulator [Clostridia bacterium]